MNLIQFNRCAQLLLKHNYITAELSELISECMPASEKLFSDALDYDKALAKINQKIRQRDLNFQQILVEQYLALHFAMAHLIQLTTEQGKETDDELFIAKATLLYDMIVGKFRSDQSSLQTVIQKIGEPLSDEHIFLIKGQLMKRVDQLYTEDLRLDEESIKISEEVAGITRDRMKAWQCAVNLSKLYAPKPVIKSPRRSFWRWFFDSFTGSIRNGCAVAVTLIISSTLLAATFPVVTPFLPLIYTASIAIGVATTAIGLLYGLYRNWRKGKTQDSVTLRSAQMLQGIANKQDSPENKERYTSLLVRELRRFDLKNSLSTLKRKQFLVTTTAGDTSEKMMSAISPIMRTGMKPDLISSAATSGIEQAAPRMLKRYWYDDERWNFYIDYLIALTKVQDKNTQYQIITEISKLCHVMNFNKLCRILESSEMTAEEIELLASLNTFAKPEQQKVFVFVTPEKEFTISANTLLRIRRFLRKADFPEALIRTLTETSHVCMRDIKLQKQQTEPHDGRESPTPLTNIWRPILNIYHANRQNVPAVEEEPDSPQFTVVPGMGIVPFHHQYSQQRQRVLLKT